MSRKRSEFEARSGAPGGTSPPPAATVIRARGLTKRFAGAAPVVDGIDLEVRRGECFGLLGPNGAGKSTTIRMILGLSPFTAGELTVLGQPVPEAVRRIRARCGVVPQHDNLDIDLTVAANLEVYGRYFGVGRREVRERMDRLLAVFQLDKRKHAPIEALSGGMKRRLAIARALINDPELVVLDEPTTGLDPQARRNAWQRLRQLKGEGRTLLLTTHYMEEAARLCDRLVVMDRGRILDLGAPGELVARNVEPQVVEVPLEQESLPDLARSLDYRLVTAGDTAYFYTHDAAPVLEHLHAAGSTTHFHRPANLEDVFLRLTGHELQEA
ncbi:ATP-binding cassette domain-containing protein [Thiohalorhabdus methylotrophus]|uniref:ATP-binding cassette domain-containing protein n=1 Tax=Thiohalorhabdus methylotrophus TaxID=3242694 RepID=A0ABV4TUW8_9GAMM